MSVYAVRTRASHDGQWTLRGVFNSRAEADQFAATTARTAAGEERSGFADAEVEEYARMEDVPEEIPEEQVAPTVARYTSGTDVD